MGEQVTALTRDWDVLPFGSLAKELRRTGYAAAELLSVYLDRGVIPYSQSAGQVHKPSLDLSAYQLVKPGDLVLNNQQAWRGSVGVSAYTGIVSPAYVVCSLSSRIFPGFARYLFRAPSMVDQYVLASKGVGSIQRNLVMQQLRRAPVPLPPSSEQRLIVRYLDHVELRISRAVQAKQEMARLLRESRQSTILKELLTSTGSAPIFDGAGYLAPEGWRNVPLWSVTRQTKRTNRPDLELLSVFLDRGVIRYGDGGGQVHKPSLDLSGYQEVRPGDLVLNNQQAWRGSLGVSSHNGIVSPAYVVCSLHRDIDPEWANSYFRSPIMVDQFALASRGVGSIQRQLHGQSLRRVRVCLPPMEEQRAIARRIRSAVAGTDAALSSLEQEVALLREYRTRLISDVVTGRKDIRADAAKMKDVDPDELASVLAGVTMTENDELGEDADAE